jgi:hypothetical protein
MISMEKYIKRNEGLLGFKKMLAAMKRGDFRETGNELLGSHCTEQIKTRIPQNYIYVVVGVKILS